MGAGADGGPGDGETDAGGDRRDRVCPNCGVGIMPTSGFCIACGAELPKLAPREEVAAADEERRKHRFKIWFFDLLPGLLSPAVIAAAICAFVVAGLAGLASVAVFVLGTGASYGIVFFFPVALLIAAVAIFSYMSGMSWLMCGEVRSPFEAWYDLRWRHWLLMFVCLVVGARLLFLIPQLLAP